MKITSLKVGQIVYTVERRKMGNTTMSTIDVRKITITEIDPEGRFVMATRNGSASRRYGQRLVDKWRVKEPVLYRYPEGSFGHRMGIKRLASRAEIKAMEEKNAHAQG